MASLQAGTVVGRYRVGPHIGAGGMGEVYEATDTQLGRRVALKVLRRSDQVERFVREARAASALGHPAIVAVYDAGEAALDDGTTIAFLAMERIDGEPFSKWLRGRRDERSVLDVLAQVADGLATAHANGIVHRDLKPENIVVTRDGYAKIVDFGAAKLAVSSDESTADGALVGTPAYMAPEQLDGTAVDHRADVFAFGCVLYEALSGRSPFRGATPVDTMHAILHADAPAVNADPELQRIVRRCLQKDREQRFQSMRDLALDLRDLGTFRTAQVAKRRPRRLQYSIAGAALVAIVLLAVFLTHGDGRPAPVLQMHRITNSGQVVTNAISPDGNYLVYVTRERNQETMWVRQVATGQDVRILEPTPVVFTSVRVSPDGNYVYYALSQRSETNILDVFRLPIVGGTPVKVVSDYDGAAALSPDGRQILFRRFNAIERRDRIYVLDVDGGTEQLLFEKRFPERVFSLTWHPDGQSIIYTGLGKDNPQKAVTRIYARLADRTLREIPSPEFLGIRSLTWLPDGSGMVVTAFDREQPPQIWFLPKDGGAARKITSDISGYGDVTVTADGNTIVATRGEGSANLWLVDLDRPREPRALTTGTANFHGQGGVRWLNDGRIVYSSVGLLRAGERKMGPTLFTTVADRFEPQPLIRNVPAWNPAVSPDGRRLAFVSDTSGPVEIWTADAAGTNFRQATHLGRAGLPSFSPDGDTLYCISTGEHQAAWKVPLTGARMAAQRLTALPANEASISPRGDQILCRLRSPKKVEGIPLWRTAVLPLDGGAPRFFPVPRFGGPPRLTWHPSGDAFLFLDAIDGVANLWQQDLTGAPPHQITFFDSGDISAFDLSQDGKRMVVSRGTSSTDAVMIRGFR